METVEQVQSWIGNEIVRLKKKLKESVLPDETASLNGSIMTLHKLKEKLKVKR